MKNWKTVNLTDLIGKDGILVDGDWVESKDQDPNGDVRLIQLADVGDGRYINKSSRFLTSEKAEELRCTFLKPNDILIARMPDPLGRACIFPGEKMPCVTVVDVCILRPNPEVVDINWLLLMINSPNFRLQLNKFILGTTRQRISRKNLEKIQFALPPLDEQKRIAAVLDKCDRVRRLRRQVISRLDQLLQAVFLDMFGDPVSNPKGWDKLSLNTLCDNITDGTHDTPLRLAEGIPFITSKNVRPFQIDLSVLDFVSDETHQEIKKRCNPKLGDILYTNIGVNVGNAVANRLDFEFSLKNVALLQPNHDKLKPLFLESLLNNERLKESILATSSVGGAQKFVTLKFLRNTFIIAPPINLQTKYESFISKLDYLKQQLILALEKSDKLFYSLQQRAFAGELFSAAGDEINALKNAAAD